jgi:hypothetical protein
VPGLLGIVASIRKLNATGAGGLIPLAILYVAVTVAVAATFTCAMCERQVSSLNVMRYKDLKGIYAHLIIHPFARTSPSYYKEAILRVSQV